MNKFKNAQIILKNNYEIKRGINLTSKELDHFRQQKLKKDIHLFESIVPYISFFFIGITCLFMATHTYFLIYMRKDGGSIWNKFYYCLLDMEIEKGENNSNEIK
jgi:hypothetical protein